MNYSLLTALLILLAPTASAEQSPEQAAAQSEVLDFANSCLAYSRFDNKTAELSAQEIGPSIDCIHRIEPALKLAVAIGTFEVGGMKVCMPKNASVVEVMHKIAEMTVATPKIVRAVDSPGLLVIFAITQKYKCNS